MINNWGGSRHLERSIVIDFDSFAEWSVFNLFKGNIWLIIRLIKHDNLVLFGFLQFLLFILFINAVASDESDDEYKTKNDTENYGEDGIIFGETRRSGAGNDGSAASLRFLEFFLSNDFSGGGIFGYLDFIFNSVHRGIGNQGSVGQGTLQVGCESVKGFVGFSGFDWSDGAVTIDDEHSGSGVGGKISLTVLEEQTSSLRIVEGTDDLETISGDAEEGTDTVDEFGVLVTVEEFVDGAVKSDGDPDWVDEFDLGVATSFSGDDEVNGVVFVVIVIVTTFRDVQ